MANNIKEVETAPVTTLSEAKQTELYCILNNLIVSNLFLISFDKMQNFSHLYRQNIKNVCNNAKKAIEKYVTDYDHVISGVEDQNVTNLLIVFEQLAEQIIIMRPDHIEMVKEFIRLLNERPDYVIELFKLVPDEY